MALAMYNQIEKIVKMIVRILIERLFVNSQEIKNIVCMELDICRTI